MSDTFDTRFMKPPRAEEAERGLDGKVVLVTGAAGFIGSHLTSRLAQLGARVRAVDCFTAYYDVERKKKNLQAAQEDAGKHRFDFVPCDLSTEDLTNIVDGVQMIVHLAAQPGVRKSWGRDFVTYIRHNILATQRLLEAVKEQQLEYFIYGSSSSVYGERDRVPVAEEAIPAPVSPYGCTKIAAEDICIAYTANYEVPVGILRFFTVYGPRQRPDMAFHKWIIAIAREEPIPVFGDGQQSRDFTYVEDAVAGCVAALGQGATSRIYNIGGGRNYKIIDVISLIARIMGKRPVIDHKPTAPGDVRHTSADIARAKSELGYKPVTALEEGIAAQIEWMKAEGII
jgi:nucleoside-diphosphate-sugar epimerase